MLLMLVSQIFNYSIWIWLIWIAITFCAVRFGEPLGIPAAWFIVTAILYVIDVRWIQAEMSKPGWDGTPDMDIVFAVGVMIRVVIFNAALLPVMCLGFWARRQSARRRMNRRFNLSAPPPTPTPG